jgi:hypothetical protein
MKLSVIIVNYNVRVFLENALVTILKALEGIAGEVIVVDNASDDGSVEMIRQKFPSVRLIVNPSNLGFAAANNVGINASAGQYLLLLNPDTIVQEDTFSVMIEAMEKNPEIGLAGCKILNSDGSLQLACRRSFPTPWIALTKIVGLSALFPGSKLFSRYNLEYLDPDASYEVDAVSGSFMFLRREVFEAVGGLDEQFFMYGEDLDWCFRVKQAGWKVFYIHDTQIIHYKGQSARRSEIDEVKLFYDAMRLFVRKHFAYGAATDLLLRLGIAGRQWIASLGRGAKTMGAILIDLLIIDASLLLGEFIRFGQIFRFPPEAYRVILLIPPVILVLTMQSFGIYSTRKSSSSKTAGAVIFGYIILSALTFFFNQYAFSRMVVLISGCINVIALPAWRAMSRAMSRAPQRDRRSLFGNRTVIVGADASGQAIVQKLRARLVDGYDVVGFIDKNRKRLGEKLAGVEILGSIDNIGKVIEEERITEVIFSTDVLSYTDILAVIGRSRNRGVNFRLVPSSLEVIIGKTHIDELGDLPFVDIDYNIRKASHRFFKRTFDVVFALFGILMCFPIFVVPLRKRDTSAYMRLMYRLPDVLKGTMSFVGRPADEDQPAGAGETLYLGKPGITGLAQINRRADMNPEEVEKYNLYYAKNQSLVLDCEILLKAMLNSKRM